MLLPGAVKKRIAGALLIAFGAFCSSPKVAPRMTAPTDGRKKSVDELAHIVRVPPSTVKIRMFCARQRMGELLRAAGYDHS